MSTGPANSFLYQRGKTPGTLATEGIYTRNDATGNPARNVRGAGLAFVSDVGPQDLVSKQLNDLIASDSRYIQGARQRGLAGAAKRGMLNSSIAQGAAERSAIDAAMPIASADAATYGQTRMLNQTELNKNLMQERDLKNKALEAEAMMNAVQQAGTGATSRSREAAAGRDFQLQLQRERLAFEGEQQGLSRQQQEMMARLGYDMDLGRMGYQFDLTDRNAGRDFQRQIYRDNNSFANEMYGMNEQARLAFGYGDAASTMNWIRDMIAADPSVPPEVYDGLQSFLGNLSSRAYGTLDRYGIGRGG